MVEEEERGFNRCGDKEGLKLNVGLEASMGRTMRKETRKTMRRTSL